MNEKKVRVSMVIQTEKDRHFNLRQLMQMLWKVGIAIGYKKDYRKARG
jgi:hypothetical protein